jgi:hypothetical protein
MSFEYFVSKYFPEVAPEISEALWCAFWAGMRAGSSPGLSDADRQVVQNQLDASRPVRIQDDWLNRE